MDIIEFAEFIVKSIVSEPDLIKVTMFDATDDITILEIIVPESEMGKVIGKNGKTSTAIKTLIQAHALINNKPKVKVNIDSF